MSPAYLRDLSFQRNQPEDRERLFRNRRPGRGHLGHSGGWQNTEGNHTHIAIHIPIQQEPQTRGLERYGSSSSAPPTPQRFISMEHEQKEVQTSIPLGRTWRKLPEDLCQRDRPQKPYDNHQRLESHQEVQTVGGEGKQDKGESSHYPSYRRTDDPDRAHSDSLRLTRSRPNHISSGFKPFRNQQVSGQESPFFTLPGGLQEKTRTQGQEQDLFSPKEERVRPNDPETVGLGERLTKEPELVVNSSIINSHLNKNITPTQIEHNAVLPESNLKSDALWLQMSQYGEKNQKQLAGLEASHERMKKLTTSMDKIVKTLQEEHAQLRKASEETNKRLNIIFEEQHHSRRERDCLDQDIKKLFIVYHNMKPQPEGHVMDNPYYQDDIKLDAMLVNKARYPSKYQDGENMSYSKKEALKQLPEASSWPKFSETGEYNHMELIGNINGIFIYVPSIPDYWITARINTAFKGHASICYTEMKEIHGRRNWPWWKSQITQTYKNDKPKEGVEEVTKKKNSCHNCGSTDHYAKNCPKAKKKAYAIEKVPEEESPTEDSDSDSMGDAIREQSDEEQHPREEFLVEYQEVTP
ncbi:hypothetical protein O181_019473 [Austropuccinia psidii MF-1]|uniref:CCHC-type domain-containing protein n=1 Tax=Austropuccinia psidii MF-1 TaxID=1389203 RepID=A0A9Q3CB27_9BASI|nr:hypothetical protein [Austropuccinia psidii MF-1]